MYLSLWVGCATLVSVRDVKHGWRRQVDPKNKRVRVPKGLNSKPTADVQDKRAISRSCCSSSRLVLSAQGAQNNLSPPLTTHPEMVQDTPLPLEVVLSKLAFPPRADPLEYRCQHVERRDRQAGQIRLAVTAAPAATVTAAASRTGCHRYVRKLLYRSRGQRVSPTDTSTTTCSVRCSSQSLPTQCWWPRGRSKRWREDKGFRERAGGGKEEVDEGDGEQAESPSRPAGNRRAPSPGVTRRGSLPIASMRPLPIARWHRSHCQAWVQYRTVARTVSPRLLISSCRCFCR